METLVEECCLQRIKRDQNVRYS